MTIPYASAALAQLVDGFAYSQGVPLTSNESDLSSSPALANYDPLAVRYGQSFIASVLFQATAPLPPGTGYVVCQGANDGVNWIDLAWASTSIVAGSALFVLSGGANVANAVQQLRQAGQAPTPAIGSNSLVLPGLLRFVGARLLGSGSSSSSSPSPGGMMLVSISVKVLGLR